MKEFKNRQNEFVTKENIGERGFFISRSVAVVATVMIVKGDERFVLMGKRGQETPDFQGCWNMPCGYLDFDENATEAVYRELYEETGLDLKVFINKLNGGKDYDWTDLQMHRNDSPFLAYNLDQPWYVQHDPSGNRQNVTLRFGIVVECDYLPELTNEYCEPGEVDELAWVNVNDVNKLKCAFKHDVVLDEYRYEIGQ